MEMNPAEKNQIRWFVLVFAASAVAFLALLASDVVGVGRTLLKAVPVGTLLVLVLREMRGFARICLGGAMAGSVCGDILLDLPYQNLFVFGLLAFLIAHLFFNVLFFRHAKRPAAGYEKVLTGGLIGFGGVMIWLFSGITPALYGPVVAYIVVIISMSIGALLVPSENRFLFLGAFLFVLSDLVLAVNKFLVTIPNGRIINITLYFIAQLVIIMAARSIWGVRRVGTLSPLPA
ncbi:MAG: lysoplasmalogenase [Desulfobacteraceae bacterium]|nr:MAG: lysoplasmalogenase [Desulfobacteraceae bacterium]